MFHSMQTQRQEHVQESVRRDIFSSKLRFQMLCQVLTRLTQGLTAVQVAGDGGMGEEEVVEVGVLLEWRYISSSALP